MKSRYRNNDYVDVSLFGYLRGGDFKHGKGLYLSGLGFLKNFEVKETTDPCPPRHYDKSNAKKNRRMKTLKAREKTIFAP